jgi:hypothetical protein
MITIQENAALHLLWAVISYAEETCTKLTKEEENAIRSVWIQLSKESKENLIKITSDDPENDEKRILNIDVQKLIDELGI